MTHCVLCDRWCGCRASDPCVCEAMCPACAEAEREQLELIAEEQLDLYDRLPSRGCDEFWL